MSNVKLTGLYSIEIMMLPLEVSTKCLCRQSKAVSPASPSNSGFLLKRLTTEKHNDKIYALRRPEIFIWGKLQNVHQHPANDTKEYHKTSLSLPHRRPYFVMRFTSFLWLAQMRQKLQRLVELTLRPGREPGDASPSHHCHYRATHLSALISQLYFVFVSILARFKYGYKYKCKYT